MSLSRFVESELGLRRINPVLKSHQFAIGRVELPYLVEILSEKTLPEDFQLGHDFYKVITGLHIDSSLVDLVVEKARLETDRFKALDDLSQTAGLTPDDPHYHAYRLAHALEHLTGCDIYERGVNLGPRRKGRMNAATAIYSFDLRIPFVKPRVDIGFYFDQNFAYPEEIAVSVKNAARKATQSMLTSSTSKINVDPAGISPIALSP